jgi:hypothetical protein
MMAAYEMKLTVDVKNLEEVKEHIATLLTLLQEAKEDSISLAEDYCPNDEQNHTRNCPKGLLGKYHSKENEPCNCGYEAKYQRHAALMEKIEKVGI